jgi:hypothetical protein
MRRLILIPLLWLAGCQLHQASTPTPHRMGAADDFTFPRVCLHLLREGRNDALGADHRRHGF